MASPQCENGYTKIANELYDKLLLLKIPGNELRVCMAVIRMTYGYGKKADAISYGQIAKAIGITRQHAIYHVQRLVRRMVLGSTKHGTRQPATIWFNKNYDEWIHSTNGGTSPKEGYRDSPKDGTLQRKKERIKKKTSVSIPEWLDKDLWQDFKEHRKKLKKPMTEKAEELLLKKLAWMKEQGHNPKHLLMTSIERGWLSVFEPKDG